MNNIKSKIVISLSGLMILLLTTTYALALTFTTILTDSIPISDSIHLGTGVITNQILNDSITISDSISINPILAIVTVAIHDSLGITDFIFTQLGSFTKIVTTIIGCVGSCSPNTNPFINSSGTSFDLQLTEIAFPAAFLLIAIFLFDKYGVKNQLIIPMALFIILGMSWVGILPSWIILIVIIITAILIANLMSRIFNGSGGGGGE